MPKHTRSIRVRDFAPEAVSLRRHFEDQFADPRDTRSRRFVWDYWHVPEQYTALRTPAYHYFPPKVYRAFHERLVAWGRKHLGCHDVSPPWMSLYLDGFHQNLHADVPHGPWAFVYSLTPWKKKAFRGGETLLLKDQVLEYWKTLEKSPKKLTKSGFIENETLYEKIPADFNQLLVFDPRIPHGVNTVQGVQDPLQGRLVIHGWFVNPRPFISGSLKRNELSQAIQGLLNGLEGALDRESRVHGVLSVRFNVDSSGKTRNWEALTNSLRGNAETARRIVRAAEGFISRHRFKKQSGPSEVTLPLIFD